MRALKLKEQAVQIFKRLQHGRSFEFVNLSFFCNFSRLGLFNLNLNGL